MTPRTALGTPHAASREEMSGERGAQKAPLCPSGNSQSKRRRNEEATAYHMWMGSRVRRGQSIWESREERELFRKKPALGTPCLKSFKVFFIAARIENELLPQPSRPTWFYPCQPLQPWLLLCL